MSKINAPLQRFDSPQISPGNGTVLVIDGDRDCLDVLRTNLTEAGYGVETAETGEAGLTAARTLRPPLVITEVGLRDVSGLEICRALRADPATESMHIVMLTARQAEVDRILGFEMGADDYVAKPFSVRELILRLKAMQRRCAGRSGRGVLQAGPICVDHSRCCAVVDGNAIDLTPTEFKLLATLAQRPNEVQSRDSLLVEVWGNENAIENRSVDTYLRRLRNKLGEAGQHIKTVYGFGYRFAC